MQRALPTESTSVNVTVKLRSATTGQLLTGVAYGDVTYAYWRDGAASGATGTCVTATKGIYADHGWVETDYAGFYQFGIPDACLAAGANGVSVKISASGAIDAIVDVQLSPLPADVRMIAGIVVAFTGWGSTIRFQDYVGFYQYPARGADADGYLMARVETIKGRAVHDPGNGNTVYFPVAAYGGKGGVPITDVATGLLLTGFSEGTLTVLISAGTGAGQISLASGKVAATVATGDGVDAAEILALSEII